MSKLNVNADFNLEMEKLTPDTPAHSDVFNSRYGQLLDNDAFLHEELSHAKENETVLSKNKLEKTGDASNVTNAFSAASTRTNLTTGEKLSISLGKIKRWLTDLKEVAFSGNYNDLNDKPSIPSVVNNNTTTEAGFALDARQANPNVDGSLAKQISALNDGLKNISVESGNFLKTDGSRQFWNPVLDLNEFYTGIALFDGNVSNMPTKEWNLVISAGVPGTLVQVAWNLWDGSMYVRHADNGVMKAWKKSYSL